MSPENVDVARAFTDAFNAGDLEGLLACCDAEIEFHSTFGASFGTVYHGHDGLRRWHRDLDDAWGEIRSTPEAFFDLGDLVLVFTRIRGRGRQAALRPR